MSENMIKLVRKGVAFIKTTPLFGGKLKRSEEAFYHSFTARHKLVCEIRSRLDRQSGFNWTPFPELIGHSIRN